MALSGPSCSRTTCIASPACTRRPASTESSSLTLVLPDGFTVADPGSERPTDSACCSRTAPASWPRLSRPASSPRSTLPPGADRPACDHRRRRRRPGPRRRLLRQADPLSAHRRVPRHRRAGVVVGGALRLRGRVLPGEGRLSRSARPRAPADLLRRGLRGRCPGRRRHADVYAFWGEPLAASGSASPRSRPPPRRPAARRPVQRQPPPDRRRHRGGGLGAGTRSWSCTQDAPPSYVGARSTAGS